MLPVGHDDVTIVERGPGHAFREVSPMTGMALWQHERRVVAAGTGSRLNDRITFTPARPLAAAAPVVAVVLRAFFRHRHRRLRADFSRD